MALSTIFSKNLETAADGSKQWRRSKTVRHGEGGGEAGYDQVWFRYGNRLQKRLVELGVQEAKMLTFEGLGSRGGQVLDSVRFFFHPTLRGPRFARLYFMRVAD